MREMLCDEDGLQARKLRHKAEEFKSKSFGREVRLPPFTTALIGNCEIVA